MFETKFTTRQFDHDVFLDELSAPVNAPKPTGSLRKKRKVNLLLSARNLPDLGFISRTDSFCSVSLMTREGWKHYARTEVCWSKNVPWWVRPITMFVDSDPMHLLFEVYQVKGTARDASTHIFIGDCELDLRSLLLECSHRQAIPLRNRFQREDAELVVTYVDIDETLTGSYLFKVALSDLNTKTIVLPNPYFYIHRVFDGKVSPVFKSSVFRGTKSCTWDHVEVPRKLLGEPYSSEMIKISVYDYKRRSFDKYIGTFEAEMSELMTLAHRKSNLRTHEGQIVGTIVIDHIGDILSPRIDDLLLKGMGLQLMFAFDYSTESVRLRKFYPEIVNQICDEFQFLTNGYTTRAIGYRCCKIFPFNTITNTEEFRSISYLMKMCIRNSDNYCSGNGSHLSPVIHHAREVSERLWSSHRTFLVLVVITGDAERAASQINDCEDSPLSTLVINIRGNSRTGDHNALKVLPQNWRVGEALHWACRMAQEWAIKFV